MISWHLLSALALLAASAPPLYFTLALRGVRPGFQRLAGLLALALLVHVLYHLAAAFAESAPFVVGVEALSAALVLVFALAYWPLRRGS